MVHDPSADRGGDPLFAMLLADKGMTCEHDAGSHDRVTCSEQSATRHCWQSSTRHGFPEPTNH